MLAEYLTRNESPEAWAEALPGVRFCAFSADADPDLPLRHSDNRMEVLFCQSGNLELRRDEDSVSVAARDIVLITGVSSLSGACIPGSLRGILLEIDGPCLMRSLVADWQPCSQQIRRHMELCRGCKLIHASPWSQTVFSALETIPPVRQGSYCVIKAAELLYLLYASPIFKTSASGGYIPKTIEDAGRYMQAHLGEKLTITNLSHRFQISPTALKSGFRQLYGIPIHRWLQIQRMNQAARMLKTGKTSILQIAHAVGYEGISQFNVTFKRQFGMTPRQYKKMSDSIAV